MGGTYFNPSSGDTSLNHNLFFGNSDGIFASNSDSVLGHVNTVNVNGDSCDAYFNLYLNPLFADTAAMDYHLTAGSPCIDAGDPNTPLDPDGTVADLGAFYYDQRPSATPHFVAQPSAFGLSSYPNPFNPVTTLRVSVPVAGQVRVAVYDVLGRCVETVTDQVMQAGTHSLVFDGARLSSGVYFARLQSAKGSKVTKLMLMK
jgi:hypothetical protein